MTKTDQNSLVTLRQNINTYFSQSEIHMLCFDLGTDPEQFPVRTQSKDELVRVMIRHFAQQGRLQLMISMCEKYRPQVVWPSPTNEEVNAWLHTSNSSVSITDKRRNQLILLEKVSRFWIHGVLDRSIKETNQVDIQTKVFNEAIDHPWHDVVDTVVYDTQSLMLHKNLLGTFSEADRALLVLGDAGTGKSITLLNLGRELISLAEQDTTQPIPVILSLVSWTEQRKKIADWVEIELNDKYQIPKQMAHSWLIADELLLLLDGLDEVPLKYRDDCINAINQFREQRGLTGLAVCCRTEEYNAAGIKLKLGGAILLQRLTPDQIDTYLQDAGTQYETLRQALHEDETLRELAQSPLMLNIMCKAYSNDKNSKNFGMQRKDFDKADTYEEHRQQIFSAYIERMFQRNSKNYSQNQTINWLIWLSKKMSSHNQAIFLIESLQPSWFPTRNWRWLYVLITRVFDGIFIALLLWLFLSNRQGTSQFVDAFTNISVRLSAFPVQIDLWPVIVLNVFLGLFVGPLNIIWYEKSEDRTENNVKVRAQWQLATVNGIVVGFVSLLIVSILGQPFEALSWSVLEGLVFFLAAFLFHGTSYRNDVRTVEALSWSWSNAIKAGLLGLGVGLITVIVGSIFSYAGLLAYDLDAGLGSVPGWIILFALLAGLRGKKIETKNSPNQGVLLSARNGFIASVLFFLFFGFYIGFLFNNLIVAIIAGLIVALGAFLAYGGINVMKHLLVRFFLWLHKDLPWNYAHFLDTVVDRLLMHRVGGGYIFIHRLLQDYFSRLEKQQ